MIRTVDALRRVQDEKRGCLIVRVQVALRKIPGVGAVIADSRQAAPRWLAPPAQRIAQALHAICIDLARTVAVGLHVLESEHLFIKNTLVIVGQQALKNVKYLSVIRLPVPDELHPGNLALVVQVIGNAGHAGK